MLELARRQLASADVIVFNKADLVSEAELAALRGRFTYPAARVIEATFADVPLEVVLGVDGARGPAADPAGHAEDGAHHRETFATWTWTSTQPLSYEAVRTALASLPPSVFRAKGFLHLAEALEQRVVAHVVGRRVDIRPLGAWNGAQPRTELVFISLDPDVDQTGVGALLTETVAPEVTSSST